MRTVLDVTVCAHSSGGVGRWVKGLAEGLAHVSQEHVSVDFPETHPGVPCPVSEAISIPEPAWMSIPFYRRIMLKRGKLAETRGLRMKRVTGTPDVLHLSGVQPLGEAPVKVVTFFDDTPWTEPERHTEETLFYAGRLAGLMKSGAGVVAISSWAAERVSELFGVPCERISVVMAAADRVFTPGEPDRDLLAEHGLEKGGYLLHVGSFVPRKNIPFLLRCFQAAGDTGRKLVLAGAEKWGDVQASGRGVTVLEKVSDSLLLNLYRGAEAVLVPSTSEGLGLPVLEALACNTPVITSDGGALRETAGDSALVLPVNNTEAWIEAIRAGATRELRERATRAERRTWSQAGAQTLEFYRRLL